MGHEMLKEKIKETYGKIALRGNFDSCCMPECSSSDPSPKQSCIFLRCFWLKMTIYYTNTSVEESLLQISDDVLNSKFANSSIAMLSSIILSTLLKPLRVVIFLSRK